MNLKKKLFITGAQGFVGRHLQDVARSSAWQALFEVVGADAQYDITDRASLDNVLHKIQPDAVIHLAAQSHVPSSFFDPEATFQVNLFGTLNVLQSLADMRFAGRFLYVGSADTYGRVDEKDFPIREMQPLRPRNPYAVSKVAAEALCYQWSQTGPFEVLMARPFNHIGSGQAASFAVSGFAKQLAEVALGMRPAEILVGDLNVGRDFTDVRDVADAYLLLMQGGISGEAYNIGTGIEHQMSRMLDALIKISGVNVKVSVDAERFRPAEQRHVICDSSKLKNQTGWQPRREINDTLGEIYYYWKERLEHE